LEKLIEIEISSQILQECHILKVSICTHFYLFSVEGEIAGMYERVFEICFLWDSSF